MACWSLLCLTGIKLGWSADRFSPLAACIGLSDTVGVRPEEGGFQVRSSLYHLSSCPKNTVFSEIVIHFKPLRGNQGQQPWLVLLWESVGLHCPTPGMYVSPP